jgi:hypothetical protein
VYEIVSSLSTLEKLACPYYMENNKALTLMNDGKTFLYLFPMDVLAMSLSIKKGGD